MHNLYLERISETAIKPAKATTHSAAYDMYADLNGRYVKVYRVGKPQERIANSSIELFPGERAMIPTGWKMCCDPGWKIEIAPRSGNAIKKGLTLINCIGIIDADYRHEVMALVHNTSLEIVRIEDGDRISQLALERVNHIDFIEGTLPKIDSNRDGGFGHTGD